MSFCCATSRALIAAIERFRDFLNCATHGVVPAGALLTVLIKERGHGLGSVFVQFVG
jgi:hypothetical protein